MARDGPDDMNILSVIPHKDIQRYCADSWIIMTPIDYNETVFDGIHVQKGRNYMHFDYHAVTMVVLGGDIRR